MELEQIHIGIKMSCIITWFTECCKKKPKPAPAPTQEVHVCARNNCPDHERMHTREISVGEIQELTHSQLEAVREPLGDDVKFGMRPSTS